MSALTAAQRALLAGALGFSVAYLVSLPKVIWGDETLHFAFAAWPDLWSAARAVHESIPTVNHGQTGMHMLLNHVLLKAFGAGYFGLRLPSYVSYGMSLLAGFLLLRRLGVSFLVSLLFLILLGRSQINLEQGWEARPYILLQGTVMAFFLCWQRFLDGARFRLTGVLLSAAAGVLFHPFFVAYAGLFAAVSSLFSREARGKLRVRLRERPWALVAGLAALLVLFVLVGKFSWFQSQGRTFSLDPYEYIKRDKSLPRFMLGTFFFPFSIFVVPLLGALTAGLLWFRRDHLFARLVPPFLGFALVLVATQTLLTVAVLRSGYWILQRQWVAGNAIAFLMAALLVEAVVRKARIPERLQLRAAGVLVALFVVWSVWGMRENARVDFSPSVPLAETEAYRERLSARPDLTLSEFQSMAHQNMLAGGPVWTVFQRVYPSNTPK